MNKKRGDFGLLFLCADVFAAAADYCLRNPLMISVYWGEVLQEGACVYVRAKGFFLQKSTRILFFFR